MEQTTICELETQLLDALKKSLTEDLKEDFMYDGLCYGDITPQKSNEENEKQWKESSKRVLFLLKDPNAKESDDVRDWERIGKRDRFATCLAYFLEGIHLTTDTYCASLEELSNRDVIFSKYPFGYVNLKKVRGKSSVQWNTIRDYAERHKDYLKKQIRELIRPNIIVCCGSNDKDDNDRKVITIAKKIYI